MHTRRDFGKLALAGLPVSALTPAALAQASNRIDSVVGGVRLGSQSYSFRDLAWQDMVAAFKQVGLGECEMWASHVEPRRVSREELRAWRLETPLDEFRTIKKVFDDAGVRLFAYNYSFREDFTDEEINRGFQMTGALGCEMITASSTVSVAPRLVPYVERYGIPVAFHGHSDRDNPNEFATPETFEKALAMSERFLINLDIGHFTAANFDAVPFIRQYHHKIPVLHIKDRKRNQGPNTPWGEGDTPIRQVLELLQTEGYPMRAMIEYEYRGESDSITEVTKCFDYCKEVLL